VLGWLLILPLALIEWVLLGVILPKIVRSPDLSQISRIFLPSVGGFRPEPLEQARYVFGITTAFLLYAAAALFFRSWTKTHPSPGSRMARWLGAGAVLVQLGLCAAAGVLWTLNAGEPLAYFSGTFLVGALVAAVAGLVAFVVLALREPKKELSTFKGRVLPRLLAFGFLAVGLLPSVYTTANVLHAHWSIVYHTSFSLEDFAAVLAGRTPLVNYGAQYQSFLPFLAIPFFRLFGLSITSFSFLMTLLSVAELTLAFAILRQVTRSDWGAAILFIPIAAIGFHGVPEAPSPIERSYSFNMYCQHPLRTFGPWLVAFLCARYLAKPSKNSMAAVFLAGAFAAVNNVDFGLPAFLASLGALLATSDVGLLPSRKSVQAVLLGALASAALAVSAFVGICLVRSGSLPHFGRWLDVQRTYVVYGFFMLPMPAIGIYWIVFGTFLAAIAVALLGLAWDESGDSALRERYGMLLFSGIFGFGASMYYVGRSHPWSLIVIFSFWGFSLSLLLWEAFSALRKRSSVRRFWLSILPTALLIVQFSIFLSAVVHTQSPLGQFERLSIRSPTLPDRLAALAGFVKSHSTAGERVVISFPYGHMLGMNAGVDNVYPFGVGSELLTFAQLDQMMDAIQKSSVNKVFGQLRRETAARLAAAGFRRTDGLPSADMPVLGPSFELWER
jgi:hypothetical protein